MSGASLSPSSSSPSSPLRWQRWVLLGVAALLLALLALPLLALALGSSPAELWAGLQHPVVLPALRLSLWTTSWSLLISVLLGTPLAWVLAGAGAPRPRHASLLRALETLVQLPVVMPPAVAGVALLMAFGQQGLLGAALQPAGLSLSFTTGAVVVAEVFVAAPLYVQGALSAFRAMDPALPLVARSFGASPLRVLWRVGLPVAAPGLLAAAAMCWARALGEFGATLMFAGNLPGRTQTLPLAIYAALEEDVRAAQALALVLVLVALALLLGVRTLHVRAQVARGGDGAGQGSREVAS